jgi:hypothetical protein
MSADYKIPGIPEITEYCVANRIGRPGEWAPQAILADHKRLVALVKDIRKDLAQARYLVTAALETVDLALDDGRPR